MPTSPLGTAADRAPGPALPVVQSRAEEAGDRPAMRSEGHGRTSPAARAGEAAGRETPAVR
ncbi:hypothetical protein, partial [Streptomyces rameus]|uniref:hypothetical protein n=1 Tax=Streptomyces rameus TaxID=68261 RepID=UPI0031EAF52D